METNQLNPNKLKKQVKSTENAYMYEYIHTSASKKVKFIP